MKRLIIFFLILTLVFVCASCNLQKNVPDTVKIDNREYAKLSVGELYPMDDAFMAGGGESILGNTYFKYSRGEFDGYISYGDDGEPNLYFERNKQDEVISYYNNPVNYDYFCLLGNVSDENNHKIFVLDSIEHSMFDGLMKCIYNKAGFMPMPVTKEDWVADEIHFYKESKDGAFSTSRGNTFIIQNGKLYFLGYYDFSNEGAPLMYLKEVPSDISNYFCDLLENVDK